MNYYDLEYKGVKCYCVDWGSNPYVFGFSIKGKSFAYVQKDNYSCSADTDHIRHEIEMFLKDTLKEYIKAITEIIGDLNNDY